MDFNLDLKKKRKKSFTSNSFFFSCISKVLTSRIINTAVHVSTILVTETAKTKLNSTPAKFSVFHKNKKKEKLFFSF